MAQEQANHVIRIPLEPFEQLIDLPRGVTVTGLALHRPGDESDHVEVFVSASEGAEMPEGFPEDSIAVYVSPIDGVLTLEALEPTDDGT